jgi:nitroreductase
MSVLDTIRKRRSVRKYKGDPVPEDVLARVLEAARLAPSAKNIQPWKFIVVRDRATKRKLAKASFEQYFMSDAAVEGLGTCWIGAFDETEVKAVLGVPEEARVLALTPLGRPDESPRERGRKPLDEIVSYEKF